MEKTYKTPKLLFRALLCGVTLTLLLQFAGFAARCNALETGVLRLHVLANSDSDEDQAVKLKVRDAVLAEAQKWYGEAEDFDAAHAAVCTHLESLEAAANAVLRAEGADYFATAEVCEMYFPTRTYENVKLPAGKYRTLRISLGEAEGHNWWCVVYPSLCLPGATGEEDLPEAAKTAVTEPERYEVRFMTAEIFNKLLEFFGA